MARTKRSRQGHVGRDLRRVRWIRMAILVLLAVVPQVILFGPSLSGSKILLPLDLLRNPFHYLPPDPAVPEFERRNRYASNELLPEVLAIEPNRRFAAAEVRSGRLPLWNTYNYCGSPFLAANNTGVFSPLRILDYLFPDPRTIAWSQLVKSLIAFGGAYLFFRHSLRVGFWPAALGAVSFPLCGFLIHWRGFPGSSVAVWLPWLLWATDGVVLHPRSWSGPALALFIACVLTGGSAVTATHLLAAALVYFAWRLFDEYGRAVLSSVAARTACIVAALAWSVGFALAAPQLLPAYEYTRLGYQQWRQQQEPSPIPQLDVGTLLPALIPDVYGSGDPTKIYRYEGNRLEGGVQAYAGLLASLFLAPLAFADRRQLARSVFWLALAVGCAVYLVGVPGLSHALRAILPCEPRHNRMVVITAFAVLSLAVMGFDALRHRTPDWQPWFWAPLLAAVLLGAWSASSWLFPAAEIRSVTTLIENSELTSREAVALQEWFARVFMAATVLCAIIAALWMTVYFQVALKPIMAGGLVLLVTVELLWNAYGVNLQSDPDLYYPRSRVPALVYLENAPAGRVCGYGCLPANLARVHRLPDVRGYDDVDPRHLIELLELCESHAPRVDFLRLDYAPIQWFPAVESPILDMLNLRYRVYRGTAPADANPLIEAADYAVTESATYLPRAFVPQRVEVIDDDVEILRRMASLEFDPRQVAFVNAPADAAVGGSTGTAEIVAESPTEITLEVDMQTAGLVVLADLWYPGWHAWVDDSEVPILRTNHALRGVVLPAGSSRVVYRYQPASFRNGLILMGAAVVALAAWGAVLRNRFKAAAMAAD